MTAILGLVYQRVPCLLGDMMISSPTPPKYTIDLPVSGQISANTPIRWDTHFFTDWRQKLIQIGPHMMVAWADSRMEATAAIKHLRVSYANADKTKLEELVKMIESLDSCGFKNLALIVLISNQEGWRLMSFGANVKQFKTPWGENACAAGTGEDALIDALEGARAYSNPDSFNQALGALIATASRMWSHDIFGIGPQEAFGGAYEVAIRKNTEIVKINNVLYLTHTYKPGVGISLIHIIKRVTYYNDYLIIQILDFTRPDSDIRTRLDEGLDVKRAQIYVVPPIDTRWSTTSPPPTPEEILHKIPFFNASHFATYVKVETVFPDKPNGYTIIHEHNTEDPPVVFNGKSGEIPTTFTFTARYMDQIKDHVKNVLKEMNEL